MCQRRSNAPHSLRPARGTHQRSLYIPLVLVLVLVLLLLVVNYKTGLNVFVKGSCSEERWCGVACVQSLVSGSSVRSAPSASSTITAARPRAAASRTVTSTWRQTRRHRPLFAEATMRHTRANVTCVSSAVVNGVAFVFVGVALAVCIQHPIYPTTSCVHISTSDFLTYLLQNTKWTRGLALNAHNSHYAGHSIAFCTFWPNILIFNKLWATILCCVRSSSMEPIAIRHQKSAVAGIFQTQTQDSFV